MLLQFKIVVIILLFRHRAKTPNLDHNDLNVTATKLLTGHFEPSATAFGGARVNSPPNAFQPPPTAPNPSIGSGVWINSRLPPISSQLESLPENTLSDFKKTVSSEILDLYIF